MSMKTEPWLAVVAVALLFTNSSRSRVARIRVHCRLIVSVKTPPETVEPVRSVFTVNTTMTIRCSLMARVLAVSRAFMT